MVIWISAVLFVSSTLIWLDTLHYRTSLPALDTSQLPKSSTLLSTSGHPMRTSLQNSSDCHGLILQILVKCRENKLSRCCACAFNFRTWEKNWIILKLLFYQTITSIRVTKIHKKKRAVQCRKCSTFGRFLGASKSTWQKIICIQSDESLCML